VELAKRRKEACKKKTLYSFTPCPNPIIRVGGERKKDERRKGTQRSKK